MHFFFFLSSTFSFFYLFNSSSFAVFSSKFLNLVFHLQVVFAKYFQKEVLKNLQNLICFQNVFMKNRFCANFRYWWKLPVSYKLHFDKTTIWRGILSSDEFVCFYWNSDANWIPCISVNTGFVRIQDLSKI